MPLLAAKDLQKTYVSGEARVSALAGVSFDVEAGDFVALMGPSGCGKSTLLHICGAMDTPSAGDLQFENIVKFMSGRAPSECDAVTLQQPGTEKCIAIVYEGHEAIRKIRDVLGPTDPSKAPPGSIRREFGSTIMVNAAHASDSMDNARREMGIVRIGKENIFNKVVEEFYGKP